VVRAAAGVPRTVAEDGFARSSGLKWPVDLPEQQEYHLADSASAAAFGHPYGSVVLHYSFQAVDMHLLAGTAAGLLETAGNGTPAVGSAAEADDGLAGGIVDDIVADIVADAVDIVAAAAKTVDPKESSTCWSSASSTAT
jgi:hypothetical protein